MTPEELDTQALEQFLQDVGPAARELITLFVNETRTRLERMEKTAAASDWQALANDAHALKSSSGTYGLTGLAVAAAELEKAGREGKGEDVIRFMNLISRSTEAALSALVATVDEQLSD